MPWRAPARRRPTKLLNFFELEPGRRIIDLPGYGYARPVRSSAPVDPLMKYCRRAKICRPVPDHRHQAGITAQDEQLVDWAAAAGWQVHCCWPSPTNSTNEIEPPH
jgi:GTP-binding protein